MKPGRPGILLDFIGAQPDWPQGFLVDNLAAAFYLVGDKKERGALVARHRPDIALILGGDALECRESLFTCRHAVPGMLCILAADIGAEAVAELERDFNLFAHVPLQISGFEVVAVLKKALAVVRQSRLQIAEIRSRREGRHFPAQWSMGKEREEKKAKLEQTQSLIRNILHSASQGLGIGAVLTYVDLMQMSAGSENPMPNPEVFTALVKNATAARQWLGSFENMLKTMQKTYSVESLSAGEVQQVIAGTVTAVDTFRNTRNHQLVVRPVHFQGKILASVAAIQDILSELLLNAFKFSPAASTVSLMCYGTSEFISLAVVNDIEQMSGGITGIPAEMEEKLFEPFFRLNNTWDDRYQEQKPGLGVGLTLAENAAQQIMSRLYVYEIELPKSERTEARRQKGQIVAELVLQKTE